MTEKKKRINWRSIDIKQIEEFCQSQYQRWREYPSLRDIFYVFIDVLWPNTVSVYKRLSTWLRDKRISGDIDWRMIRDGSGRERSPGDYEYVHRLIYIENLIKALKKSPDFYRLPKWEKQSKRVIVICEKEADYPVVKAIVDELNVDVAYIRGYSGWRMLFEIAETFEKEGKDPIVICIGDFDPSGEDIVRFIKDALKTLGIWNIKIEKVIITKDQVEKLDLPHRPEDEKEILKLRRDPRFQKWPHGLYRVETASLKSRHPEEFEKTITEAILKHFDEEIYRKIEEEESEIQDTLSEAIENHRDLIEELRKKLLQDIE